MKITIRTLENGWLVSHGKEEGDKFFALWHQLISYLENKLTDKKSS